MRRIVTICLATSFFAATLLFLSQLHADDREPRDPILVAHRGLLRHAPENTLPAFSTCLEMGIGFELDIRTTKDGHLVVIHDDTLGRTTNGPNKSVKEFTLKELKRFDAGFWFHPRFQGVTVPTLEETFQLIKRLKRDSTIIALNVKDVTAAGERQFVKLVEEYRLFNESFAFDQSAECSQRLKKLNPELRIGANVNRQSINARLKEGLLDVFLVTFVPTAEEVQHLHKHGKQAVYNFGGSGAARRNPKAWSLAKQSGLDGMLTDFPLECRLHWREKPSD